MVGFEEPEVLQPNVAHQEEEKQEPAPGKRKKPQITKAAKRFRLSTE